MTQKTPDLQELHTDGSYGSEDNDLLQAKLGITAVQTGIRGFPARAPMRIEPLEAGLYQITCAAGYQATSEPSRIRHKATFVTAGCSTCPLAAVCPGKLRKDGGRTYYFRGADALRQARHRNLAALPPERQTLRANIEATMKEFKAPCRKGKLRTRGRAAAAQYGALRAIGINFGRIYRHLRKKSGPDGVKGCSSQEWLRTRSLCTAPLGLLRRLAELLRGSGRPGDGIVSVIATAS